MAYSALSVYLNYSNCAAEPLISSPASVSVATRSMSTGTLRKSDTGT